jgi:hypothetical protein
MPKIEICANCGKPFMVYGDQWGYAYAGKRTCTYRCMRLMRARDIIEYETGDIWMSKNHFLTDEEKEQIRVLRGQGLTYRKIAERLGGAVNMKSVSAYCIREHITGPENNEPEKQDKQETGEAASTEAALGDVLNSAAQVTKGGTEGLDPVRIAVVLCDAIELIKQMYEDLKGGKS